MGEAIYYILPGGKSDTRMSLFFALLALLGIEKIEGEIPVCTWMIDQIPYQGVEAVPHFRGKFVPILQVDFYLILVIFASARHNPVDVSTYFSKPSLHLRAQPILARQDTVKLLRPNS